MSERFACIDCGISLPAHRAAHVLVQRPPRRVPRVRRARRARRRRPRARRAATRRAPCARASCSRGAGAGRVALATELARAVEALGVSPDVPWRKLPEEHAQGHPLRRLAAARQARAPARNARAAGATRASSRGSRSASPRGYDSARGPRGRGPDADEGGIADDELGRFLVTRTCDACKGRRLRPEALAVKLGGKDIAQLGAMPLRELVRTFVEGLGEAADGHGRRDLLGRASAPSPSPLLKAVAARLGFLIDVGLDYLALDRSAQTLSSRRGPAHPPRHADRRRARRRPLRARRAARGPPRPRQRAPHRGAGAPARPRQHRLRRRARPRGHPRRRPRRRHGAGRGRRTAGTIVAQGTPAELMARPASRSPGPGSRGKQAAPHPRASARRAARHVRPRRRRARPQPRRTSTSRSRSASSRASPASAGAASRASSSTRCCPRRARKLYNATAPVGECDARRGARRTSTRSSRSTRPPSAARRARTRRRTRASSRSCASSTPACPTRAPAATRRGASRST